MKNIKEIVKSSLLEFANDPKSICVAFSGGSDSVCLLHILHSLSKSMGFTLSAIHINHNIRGEEAKRDEDFCIEFCKSLNVPLKVQQVLVLDEAGKGESVEIAARRLRYEAFEALDVQYIATAHNADDSLETFLINFCRGTGLKGLTGIPNVRGRFIRPLNRCSKSDILEYIKSNGLEYVTDSTNLLSDYTRNKIRNNVIPKLKEVSPELVNISLRNIELLKSDNDYLENQANELFARAFYNGKLKINDLFDAHNALLGRVLLRYAFEITNRYPDNFHLSLMLDLINNKTSAVELFDGFYAKTNKEHFYIIKKENFEFSVETEVVSKEKFNADCKINKLLLKNAIDYDKIVGELKFRVRTANDRLRPLGRGISKPVRRLQAEAGIDSLLREKAPIAFDDNGVAWGYKIGIDERFKIEQTTKNVLIFKIFKDGANINE
jgi:tRNA(Ile)-lysidine synthase